MFQSVSPRIKTVFITLIYILLSFLPKRLGYYLNDDIFNYALCIVTFTFVAIAHNFSTLSTEFKRLHYLNPISLLLFIISGACFAGFVIAQNYTSLNFNFLLPMTSDFSLISILKLFAICYCLHVNESYLFTRFANAFKKDTRAAFIFPALIYFLIQMGLAILTNHDILTSFIYYGVTAILLGLIRDERESTHLYIFSATIIMLSYALLF